MAKSTKETGLIIGGAVIGLLMSGTASAATSASTANGKYFQLNDVQSGYHFSLSGTDDKDKKDKEGNCGEGSCGEGSCGEGSCGDKKDKEKK